MPGGKVREQAAILDDITEATANFHDCFGCDLFAIKLDFTAVSRDEPNDQAQNGRLSATARADQGSDGAALDFKIEFANCEIVSETFSDGAKVNESVHENRQLQLEEKEAK